MGLSDRIEDQEKKIKNLEMELNRPPPGLTTVRDYLLRLLRYSLEGVAGQH